MSHASEMRVPATVKKTDTGVDILVMGAPITNRLRGRGPGVPREEAATAIAMVAQTTSYGSWPKGITPRIFGRALRRTLPNACDGKSTKQILAEMLEGFNDAGTPVTS